MTTPVAFPALANIDLNSLAKQPDSATDLSKWIAANNNVDGSLLETGKGENQTGVSCGIGITKLSRTFSNLPKGNYILEIKNLTNATYTIKIGDAAPVSGSQIRVDNVMRDGFRIESDKADVVIEITPNNNGVKKGFKFDSMNFELVYDFAQATLDDLTALKNAITADGFIHVINPGVTGQDALTTAGATLARDKNTLAGNINELLTAIAGNDNNKLFEAYKKGEFFKSPNKYVSDGETLKSKVAAHNQKVDAANTAHDNAVANLENYNTLVNGYTALFTKLTNGDPEYSNETVVAKLEALIKATDKNQTTKLQLYKDNLAAAKKLADDLKTFKADLDKAYEAGKLANDEEDDKYAEALQDYENVYTLAAGVAWNNADTLGDIAAYDAFTKGEYGDKKNVNYVNFLAAEALYDKLQREFNGFESEFAAAVTNEFAKELTAKWKEICALFAAPDRTNNVLKLAGIVGAATENKAQEAKDALADAASETGCLAQIKVNADAWRKDQLNQKKVADAVIKSLNDAKTEIDNITIPAGFKADIDKMKAAAASSINAIQSKINAAYGLVGADKLQESTWESFVTYDVITRGAFDENGVYESVTVENATTEELTAYKAAVDALNGDGGVANLATRVKNMQNAVAAVNNPTLTKLTSAALSDDMSAINALKASDLGTDKYIKAKDSVEKHEAIFNTIGTNVGLIDAFKAAYSTGDVEGLKNYIETGAQTVEGASYYYDKSSGKKVNFSRDAFVNAMVIKINNKNITLADRAAQLAADADVYCTKFESDLRALSTALTEFGSSADVQNLKNAIAAQREAFNYAVSNANYNAAKDAIGNLDKALKAADALAGEVPLYGEIESLAGYTDAANAKVNAGGSVYNAYDKVVSSATDSNAKKLYEEANNFINKDVKNLEAKAAKTIANINAYAALVSQVNAADAAITNVTNRNNQVNPVVGYPEANKHYADQIAELRKTKAALDKEISDAAKSKDVTKNAAALESTIAAKIKALKTSAESLQGAINDNITKYQKQGQEADALRQQITAIKDELANKHNGDFNPWKETTDKLEKGIISYLDAIAASYNKGNAVADELTHLGTYNELLEMVKQMQSNLDTEYTAEVRKANEAFMAENWNGEKALYTTLFNTYSTALSTNSAYQLVTNLGFSKFLAEVDAAGKPVHKYTDSNGVEHSGLVDQKLIRDQNEAIEKANSVANSIFNAMTAKGTVITKANFKEDKTNYAPIDQATTIKTALDGYLADMEFYMNSAAMDYFAGAYNATPAVNDDAKRVTTNSGLNKTAADNQSANKTALSGIGVNNITLKAEYGAAKIDNKFLDNTLKAGNDALTAVYNSYKSNSTKLGYAMSAIADELDKVVKFTEEQNEAYASQYWAAYVAALEQRINDWKTANTNNALKNKINAFNTAKAEIATANNTKKFSEKSADDANKTNLQAWKIKLETAFNDVQTEYAKIYGNKYATEMFNKNIDSFKNGVDADYQTLKQFTNDLAASNNMYAMSTTLRGNVKSAIDEMKTSWTQAGQDKVTSKTNEFNKNLHLDYGKVADAEIIALQTQWGNTNAALVAAVNAKVEGLEDVKAEIANLQKQLFGTADGIFTQVEAAKKTDGDPAKIAAITALKADFLKLEERLTTLENTLANAVPGADKDAAKNAAKEIVNKRFAEVSKDVKAVTEFYKNADSAVQSKYADFAAADYAGQMNALETKIASATAVIVMQKDNYLLKLDEIAAGIEGKLAAMTADQTKVDNSNKIAEGLLAAQAAYAQRLDTLEQIFTDSEYFANAQSSEKKPGELKSEQEKLVDEVSETISGFRATLADVAAKINSTNSANDLDKRWKYKVDGTLPTVTVDGYDQLKGNLDKLELKLYQESFNGTQNVWASEVEIIKKALSNPFLLSGDKAALIETAKTVGAERSKISTNCPTGLSDIKKAVSAMDKVITALRKVTSDAADHSYLPGDLNNDKVTNVFDVTEMVNLILEGSAYEDLDEIKARAADLDFNKTISVGDLTKLTNLVLKQNHADFTPRTAAPARDGANIVSISLDGVEGGVSRYAVNIQNSASFVAGQLDLVLADGMTLVDVKGASRTSSHDVLTSASNGRILIHSMENAAIEGSEGAVVYVDVIGTGKLSVDNVIFATASGSEVRLAKPEGTSGIEDTVIDNNGSLKQRIYNAAGQALRGLQRGVNIIRNADGSVTKELH